MNRFSYLYILLMLYGSLGSAATSTTNMNVSATVVATCVVGASSLAFGNYDPTSASDTTAMGTIAITCTPSETYTVALNKGLYGTAVTARKMQDASTNNLNYFINRTNCGTALCNNWGQTNGTDTVNGIGTGALQNLSVYGVIPAHQSSSAGVYSDVVAITVTFPFP